MAERGTVGGVARWRDQMLKKPLLCSLASAFVWMGVATACGYAVSTIQSTLLDAVKSVAGGLVAAPVIGLLIGRVARRFSRMSFDRRLWIALRDLYLGTYLFLLATSAGQVIEGLVVRNRIDDMPRLLIVTPLLGTVLGLTYTGFVVVLFPLSYINHVLVGMAYDTAAGAIHNLDA